MGSLIFWECDDESDFDGEVLRRGVQKTDDSCRRRFRLEDLVIYCVDDKASVWLYPLREDGSEEPLL